MRPETSHTLEFYLSIPHACGYLPDRQSVNLVLDPTFPVNGKAYEWLLQRGFRRSGEHVYRPHCPTCQACVPVRIPVGDFESRRRHRRTWRRNQDLSVRIRDSQSRDEHFELYARYVNQRHAHGGMDEPDPNDYRRFLTAHWVETWFVEFRTPDALLGVTVVDRLPNALSAVYTFFAPEAEARSLGSFAILWQIEAARARGLSHVYLGYWIQQCRKMAYKNDYPGVEALTNGRWHRLESTGGDPAPSGETPDGG
jgi:arginine-tRNA-protein transferase